VSDPCIVIDVSKGESHFQAFLDLNVPFCKVQRIFHTVDGFTKVKNCFEALKKLTDEEVLVVFEYTGIYHKTMEAFLKMNDMAYQMVSPLRSAKSRNTLIHSVKTDKHDPSVLAHMYYTRNLGVFYLETPLYADLRALNRQYETNKYHLQKIEVNFNEILDIIYPNIKSQFSDLLAASTRSFLKKCPHPAFLIRSSCDEIAVSLKERTNHSDRYCLAKADELHAYALTLVPGCSADSVVVSFLLDLLDQLDLYLSKQQQLELRIIETAKQTEYYQVLLSFPGIGPNLASRIIAETGDFKRFRTHSQLTTYAGTDPIVWQSGKMTGEHLHISKRGNKRLRTLLFLVVRSMVRKNVADNSIRNFYEQKKAQPNVPPKVALTACINKLLRIILPLCKNGELFLYTPTV
jgi:transposase